MKALLKFVFALLLSVVLAALMTGVAAAAADAKPTVLQLTTTPRLDAKGHKLPGQFLVVVTLKTGDGQPANAQTVTIWERGQFMGKTRDAKLGTVTTDSTGVAALAYQPAQTGAHLFVAKSTATDEYASAAVTTTAQFSQVVPPFPEQAAPLVTVRHWLTVGVEGFVLAFWIFLLGLFLRTVYGIYAAGRLGMAEEGAELPGPAAFAGGPQDSGSGE